MWRWLNSLPRVVRQQCTGPGASAGIHVEEINDSKDFKKTKQQSCEWKSHCRKKEDKDYDRKKDHRYDIPDFWSLVLGSPSHIDAIGLGGALALGIQFGHFKFLHRISKDREETRRHCLLSTIVLHALPVTTDTKLSITSGNVANKQNTSHSQQSSDETWLHKATLQDKSQNTKDVANETPEVETLEQAFKNFEDVCKKYTATGKGILGSQEAQQGHLKSAAALWEEAANLGNTKSRFNLAVCYETGRGVKKNLKESVRWYKLAAEDFHPQAMYNLGQMYLQGSLHTPRDPHRGLQLISAAADLGLAEAQCYLGVYYTEDQTENESKAVHYLTLASNQQNAEAQYFLGLCYQHGYGVDENLCKASDLYSKSAGRGNPDAMFSLAIFHQEGLGGLPQDKKCAQRLLRQAADCGCQDAIHEIQMSKKPTQNQSTVIQQDATSGRTPVSEPSKNMKYQFKLNSSVSTPCLTDLLRENMIPFNKDLFCDPVSNTGTLSQLYTQLMVPRGFTITTSETKNKKSRSPSPIDADSDSGVVFKLGLYSQEEEHSDSQGTEDVLGTSCSLLHRRTSTMPDLNIIPCI